MRPLVARRVNAVSLKVARGPLRAISRLGSAQSDIFFFPLVEQARKLRSREKESLPLPFFFSLSRVSRFFPRCAAIYGVEHSHRALHSLGEIECVISPLGITCASLWIPSKEEEMETSWVRRKEQRDENDDVRRCWQGNSRSSVSNVRMEETKKGAGERKGKERKEGSERDSGEKSQLLCVAQRSNGKERRG